MAPRLPANAVWCASCALGLLVVPDNLAGALAVLGGCVSALLAASYVARCVGSSSSPLPHLFALCASGLCVAQGPLAPSAGRETHRLVSLLLLLMSAFLSRKSTPLHVAPEPTATPPH